jgi:hypothetical protein
MILVFILVVYSDEPESLTILFLLYPIGSAIEGYFHFDIQHLSLFRFFRTSWSSFPRTLMLMPRWVR